MIVLACILIFTSVAFAAPTIRIVGGSDAAKGQFPYQVSLQFCVSGSCEHTCGGAVITPSWILTAGHCVTDVPSYGAYQALVGILKLDDTNPERQLSQISQSIVHPDYEGGVGPNDVALLELSSPLVYNELVQAISLPSAEQETSGEALLSGWGSTSATVFPKFPNTLQKASLPIVEINECKKALDDLTGGGSSPLDLQANVCTGPLSGGAAACSGDSGGPLAQNGEVVGIVSWRVIPCGLPGAPSVYTRVSHYVDWIRKTVGGL